jgi:hypothetical protein
MISAERILEETAIHLVLVGKAERRTLENLLLLLLVYVSDRIVLKKMR